MSNDPVSNCRIPEGWREVTLTSVAEPRFSSVDKITVAGEEPVRLCNYTDVYDNDYITSDLEFMHASATEREIDRFGLQIGDVIITKDSETPNDIGISSVVDYDAPDLVCGYHLALIRPNKEAVDPTFLSKQLTHSRLAKYFGRMANGLTRYGLPIGSVHNAPIWLPTELNEQVAIGGTLRLVDEAIAKTQNVIAKLRQLRAGLLHDLLTRGLDEDGELRDPLKNPQQFQDSAVGCMPRQWNCKTLDEAANWFSGGTPSRSQSSWWSGDVPFLTPKDMKSFEILDTIEHVTEVGALSGSKIMQPETTFIVVRGMILAHTFPVCFSSRPFAFNQDIKALRAREDVRPRFLAHWFAAHSSLFLRMTTEATHGTKKLDLKDLKRVHLGVPHPDEQSAIVERIDLIDRNIRTEVTECEKLYFLKAGLMSDLLTGCVRLPESIGASA
jgi:type I restriction enzyme, S subunit